MPRSLSIIGAPSSAGAYAPGQEKAPAAFRKHGLAGELTRAGWVVRDRGDVGAFRWRSDPQHPKSMNLDAVCKTARSVADEVAASMADGHSALVLGGDCTVELGTVAGATRDASTVGLVYIDLDVDLNTPQMSDGALDWTGIAHLLDLPGTESELSGIGGSKPMLRAPNLLLFASHNIMPHEAELIEALDLRCITLEEVKSDPAAAATASVRWADQYDRLLVHLDVDVLSFVEFPVAENVRRCPGLSLHELSIVLGTLLRSNRWSTLTIAEVNPDHAPDEAETFTALIQMLCRALSPSQNA